MSVDDTQKDAVREALEVLETQYVPYAQAASILSTHLAYARTLINAHAEEGGVDIIDLHGKPLIRREYLTEIQEIRSNSVDNRTKVKEERSALKAQKAEEREKRATERAELRAQRAAAKAELMAQRQTEAEALAEQKKAASAAKKAEKAARAAAAATAAPEAQPAEEVLEAEPA
jgi:hypothetical protein